MSLRTNSGNLHDEHRNILGNKTEMYRPTVTYDLAHLGKQIILCLLSYIVSFGLRIFSLKKLLFFATIFCEHWSLYIIANELVPQDSRGHRSPDSALNLIFDHIANSLKFSGVILTRYPPTLYENPLEPVFDMHLSRIVRKIVNLSLHDLSFTSIQCHQL